MTDHRRGIERATIMRCAKTMVSILLLAAAPAVRAADLTAGDVILAQGGVGAVVVSGLIGDGEEAFGTTILLELAPLAVNAGTVTFTLEADVTQAGDPWPGAGLFTFTDAQDPGGSPTLNASVDDNGLGLPTPVSYAGNLSDFPIEASQDADGVWIASLTVLTGPLAGLESEWSGNTAPITLTDGIIVVNADTCTSTGDCTANPDPCIDVVCNVPIGMCEDQSTTNPCDDADVCTADDSCADGVCSGTPIPNCTPESGDFDGDGDIDLDDIAHWPDCVTGPNGGPIAPGCDTFDFDGDGDVDWADWRDLQIAFTGA